MTYQEDRRGRRWSDAGTWYPIVYWPLDIPGSHRKTRLVRHLADDRPMRGSFVLGTGAPTAGFTVVRGSARPVHAAIPGVWVLPDAALGSDTAYDKQTSDRGEADQFGEAIERLARVLNAGYDPADVAVLDQVLDGSVRLTQRADRPGAEPTPHAERPDLPGRYVRVRGEDRERLTRLVDEFGLLNLGGVKSDPARPYRLTAAGAALRTYAHRGDDPTPEATP